MRKKHLFILFFFLLIFVTNAQDKGYGLGIVIGEPTGISGKYWVTNTNAFDAALAYSFAGSNNKFALHVNYLYHLYDVINSEEIIPIYYGFGARYRDNSNSEDGLGIRGVIGINYFVSKLPIDFFFEIAPVFELVPSTEIDLDLGLGVRYFFK